MNAARATVLVVDDEPGIREMLAYELTEMGFEVETADSGMAAVRALERRRFDLAVTDLKMPGMDGVATVQALRGLDPAIQVIVATGYASVDTAVACMKGGAYDYIHKPFDMDELRLLLERALEKGHLQGSLALYEASRSLLATLAPADLVRLVFTLARRVLRADDIGLLLARGEPGVFDVHCPPGASLSAALLHELASGVLDGGAPRRLPSPAWPELPAPMAAGGHASALVYPLVARDRLLGALAVLRRTGSPEFSRSELDKGAVFSGQLALSLDNARLHEELGRRVQELMATREQLIQSEKLAFAGHLARSVGHEINNPLAIVRANLDSLRDYSSVVAGLSVAAMGAAAYLAGQPVADAQEHARRIAEAHTREPRGDKLVHDITEVIDETLDGVQRITSLVKGFALLSATGDKTPAESVELRQVVAECLAELPREVALEPSGAAAEAPSCPVLVVREDLRAALFNLLGYVCAPERERAPEGPAPRVRVGRVDGRPTILLLDETLLLSAEDRRRLFDPRVEVHSVAPHLGRTMRLNLALALAYQMLQRNGADISTGADGPGLSLRIAFDAHDAAA